jgi:hypothetical protein
LEGVTELHLPARAVLIAENSAVEGCFGLMSEAAVLPIERIVNGRFHLTTGLLYEIWDDLDGGGKESRCNGAPDYELLLDLLLEVTEKSMTSRWGQLIGQYVGMMPVSSLK